jgi:hypothetical protein
MKIEGYRDLSDDEVDLMNRIKKVEGKVAALHREVTARIGSNEAAKRWASIGRTQIEGGFMFLLKAVAQPTKGLGHDV